MSLFPTNARTGQTHKKFGRKYSYSETTKTWTPIVPLASVAEVRKAEVTSASATYTLASDGTPTVITLAATDADGHDITWSYEVVSGSLGGGGAGADTTTSGTGGGGAVRIIWGAGRAFPSTNTADV